MTRKFAPLILFAFIFSFQAFGQTETTKTRRPDIPGTFVLELGINRLTETPNDLKYGLWGSRTSNVYYLYNVRLGKSKFTFHPGIGLGMERFKLMSFNQYYPIDTVKRANPTLAFDNAGNTVFMDAARVIYDDDTLGQVDWSDRYTTRKSMVAMNYIDIPLEIRFNTNPEDPARSFKIGIGGRVGYLINAHTKIKYKENGELKILKNNQDFNLSPLRYSVFFKVYAGNFSFFSYYNLNPMFKEGKGPMGSAASVYTVGISLASF